MTNYTKHRKINWHQNYRTVTSQFTCKDCGHHFVVFGHIPKNLLCPDCCTKQIERIQKEENEQRERERKCNNNNLRIRGLYPRHPKD